MYHVEGWSTILTIYSEAVPAAVQDAVIINAEPKSTQIASCEVRDTKNINQHMKLFLSSGWN